MIRSACACAAIAVGFAPRTDAATLRAAHVTVMFSSGTCEVTSRFVVDTADPAIIDHHVLSTGDVAPRVTVLGAIAGETSIVGRTARVPLSLTGTGRNEYSVRYAVTLPAAARDRCPLLVPAAPTDGVSRTVRLEVDVPREASRLPGEFPAFAWDGLRGAVTIGHMPSFVRVPHVAPGAPVTWRDTFDVRRAVDVFALAIIVISTLAWTALRRRQA